MRARLPQDLRGFGDMFCPPWLKIMKMFFFFVKNLLLLVVFDESGPRPTYIYSDFFRLLDMRESECVSSWG